MGPTDRADAPAGQAPAPPERAAALDALLAWFRARGGELHPNVEIRWSPTSGWGLWTTAPLPPGTAVITVPERLFLWKPSASVGGLQQLLVDAPVNPWVALLLQVLHERGKADLPPADSKAPAGGGTWGPYWAILPDEFDQPSFWVRPRRPWHDGNAGRSLMPRYATARGGPRGPAGGAARPRAGRDDAAGADARVARRVGGARQRHLHQARLRAVRGPLPARDRVAGAVPLGAGHGVVARLCAQGAHRRPCRGTRGGPARGGRATLGSVNCRAAPRGGEPGGRLRTTPSAPWRAFSTTAAPRRRSTPAPTGTSKPPPLRLCSSSPSTPTKR